MNRAHSVGVVMLAACGRISFDPGAVDGDAGLDGGLAPELAITASDDELVVEVPGRFTLRFAEARDWFAVDWRDASAPDEPLVPAVGDLDKTVLQGLMIEMPGADFQGSGSGIERSFEVLEHDVTHVSFQARFELVFGADVVAVEVVNDLDRDGHWSVVAEVSSIAGVTNVDTFEYADSHVEAALPWTKTTSIGSYTWRRDGASPRATFKVTGPPALTTPPQADEANNLYFSESTLTLPMSRTWTAVIWPPT